MNQMNIFGDDDAEATLNSDSDDFFFSDINPHSDIPVDNINIDSIANTNRNRYGYSGRSYTGNRYIEDEPIYERSPRTRAEHKRERDLAQERRYRERNSAYNNNRLYRNREYRPPMFGHRDRYRTGYNSYRTPTPHFTKEQNVNFITSLIGIALLMLLIVFVCRGDSAFAGVTSVIVIMYVMNFLTKNKKGPRGK